MREEFWYEVVKNTLWSYILNFKMFIFNFNNIFKKNSYVYFNLTLCLLYEIMKVYNLDKFDKFNIYKLIMCSASVLF